MPETTGPRVDPTEEGTTLARSSSRSESLTGSISGTVYGQGELRPGAGDEAQAAISADIDAILKRLEEGAPRLFEDMKAVQSSLRRPLAV